jgi:hypothetical protein
VKTLHFCKTKCLLSLILVDLRFSQRGYEELCRLGYNALSKEAEHLALCSCWSYIWLIIRSWRWKRNFPPKRHLIFKCLYGVISQKTAHIWCPSACNNWRNAKRIFMKFDTIARTVLEDIWGGVRRGLLRSSSLSQESSVVQLALRGT